MVGNNGSYSLDHIVRGIIKMSTTKLHKSYTLESIYDIRVYNDSIDTDQIRGGKLKACILSPEFSDKWIYSEFLVSDSMGDTDHRIEQLSKYQAVKKILELAESCNSIFVNEGLETGVFCSYDTYEKSPTGKNKNIQLRISSQRGDN
jgi:hypothetical protein